ncbi:DoxX family protein [Sphingomonas koreensis]|nr:DoxX family protein [Sphingomonas koreensis]
MQGRAEWFGRMISALTAVVMIADGITGLFRPSVIAALIAGDGWPPQTVLPIAALALAGGLLYAVPRTALLGAIVITGFVGGALAVHLRVTLTLIWPEIVNVLIGVGAWTGLYLRDARLRALLLGGR